MNINITGTQLIRKWGLHRIQEHINKLDSIKIIYRKNCTIENHSWERKNSIPAQSVTIKLGQHKLTTTQQIGDQLKATL